MGITVTSPALRLVHVVWSLQTPTKEFLKYFLPSKPNHLSHSKKTSVRLPSSLAIPSGMLATNHPGGPQSNLTSNCSCFVIAVACINIFFCICYYTLVACFCLLLALHRIMVTFTDDHGTWPGLLCTIFFCLLDILLCLFIFLPIKID